MSTSSNRRHNDDPLAPYRGRLLGLAYRMLGSRSDAEDVVQDAYIRFAGAHDIHNPEAFLVTIVTRLCLDRLKSAKAQREVYVGPWLPEPVFDAQDLSAGSATELADDLSFALLLALDRLSPMERAAFLLHDVFGVALNDVAGTLDRAAAAVRQLASRARRHVQEAKPRYAVEQAEAERITRAFFAAVRDGDVASLRTLLAEDVVLRADGGGKVLAFHNPIHGIAKMLRLFAGIARKYASRPELLRLATIDGLPGYVSIDRGDFLQTTALEVREGRIAAIYITRNPDKLRHVAALVEASTDTP